MNAYYSGHPLTQYREGDKQIPIMLRLPPEQRGSLSDLDAVFVQGLTGKVPLNSVANVQRRWVNARINRNQRARCFSVGARPVRKLLYSQVKTKTPRLEFLRHEARTDAHFWRFFAVIRAYLADLSCGRFIFRPSFGCHMCEFRDHHCQEWSGFHSESV